MRKKLLFIVMLLISLFSISKYSFASEKEIVPLGIGDNKIDYDHFKEGNSNGKTYFYYDGWCPNPKINMYFFMLGVKASANEHEMKVQFSSDNKLEVTKEITLKSYKDTQFCTWELEFSQYKDYEYFRISYIYDANMVNKPLSYYSNKILLIDEDKQVYYNPYYYKKGYTLLNDYSTKMYLVTTPDKPFDVETYKNHIIYDTSKGKLRVSEDDYTGHETEKGKHTVCYYLDEGMKTNLFYLHITVQDIAVIELKRGVSDHFVILDSDPKWFVDEMKQGQTSALPQSLLENFNITMPSDAHLQLELITHLDLDGDGEDDRYIDFVDLCNRFGNYDVRLNIVDKDEHVLTYVDFYIDVIDHADPEMFGPDIFITLDEKTYSTRSQLLEYIKRMLNYSKIEAKNLTIIKNDYELNAGVEGDYEVVYKYDVDDKTYYGKCNVNVAKGNKNGVSDGVNKINDFDSSTIYISIIIGLVSLIGIYFIVTKAKNRKKNN